MSYLPDRKYRLRAGSKCNGRHALPLQQLHVPDHPGRARRSPAGHRAPRALHRLQLQVEARDSVLRGQDVDRDGLRLWQGPVKPLRRVRRQGDRRSASVTVLGSCVVSPHPRRYRRRADCDGVRERRRCRSDAADDRRVQGDLPTGATATFRYATEGPYPSRRIFASWLTATSVLATASHDP